MSHKRLSQDDRSAILVRSLGAASSPHRSHHVALQEFAAEPRTQVSRGDVSIDISHASLVVPHGQTQAEERQQAKPKLAQFACSFYEASPIIGLSRHELTKVRYRSSASSRALRAT